MPLFPAYALEGEGQDTRRDKWDVDEQVSSPPPSAALEESLLASASSEEEAPPPPPPPPPPPCSEGYYLDVKADNTNLGVTTLYYPGRPIYKCAWPHALGSGRGRESARRARRRYYSRPAPAAPPAHAAADEVAARRAAYRRMLADAPRDEELWLRYIYFQEEWGEARSWLEACEGAVRAGAGGQRVRAQLHRARVAALPHAADLLRAISEDIRAEKRPRVRLEQWVRLVRAAGGAGGAGDAASGARRAAEAALADLPHLAPAYPRILHAYGAWLREAGLWEQLVLLVELVCAMNFPPAAAGAFPPPRAAPAAAAAAEARLHALEDEAVGSGLPSDTVWVRVERLRGAAHWRPSACPAAEADPARAPSAHAVQALLRAVPGGAALAALAALLRLAQVPPLPASCAARRALGAHDAEEAAPALLALARAARRLPPAAPAATGAPPDAARALALRRTLATVLDPPHYFSDEHGYLAWTSALWEACCGWAGGARRLALVCWRLRWLHALARLAPEAERRRLRAEARAVLREHAAAHPVAFALFARIDRDCGNEAAALRAATQAARAAAGEEPREHALFAARVLRELQPGGGEAAPAQWALCCAALGRALPPDDRLAAPPPAPLLQSALDACTVRCRELEEGFGEEGEDGEEREEEGEGGLARALTCAGAGEWLAARVALLPPAARRLELERLLALPYARVHQSTAALQYFEAGACAAAAGAGAGAARRLLPLFPDNALLAAACGGGPAGAWAPAGAGGEARAAARSHTAALARALPPLLRAPIDHDASPHDMERVSRELARAGAGGAGGAALCTLRLEAAARAAGQDARRVLLAALADHPHHKWLLVRGAAWSRGEAAALCDAALERGLRVHALPDELRPLPSAPAPTGAR